MIHMISRFFFFLARCTLKSCALATVHAETSQQKLWPAQLNWVTCPSLRACSSCSTALVQWKLQKSHVYTCTLRSTGAKAAKQARAGARSHVAHIAHERMGSQAPVNVAGVVRARVQGAVANVIQVGVTPAVHVALS